MSVIPDDKRRTAGRTLACGLLAIVLSFMGLRALGCASSRPTTDTALPAGSSPALRAFGITLRSSERAVLEPSGVIHTDAGERIIGVNHIVDGGTRLQFETTATRGGWLTISADGYEPVVLRVTLDDQPDVILERLNAPMKRLRVEGRQLIAEDGSAFVWRFASGFRLVDHVADGNETTAVAFLDWAAKEGFTGVRVLSTLCCWFDLAPADGQRALPRLLELAQARGLYLEVVGLARRMDRAAMASHVRAIGLICSASPACATIELANENAHPAQQDDLTDLAFLQMLKSLVPAGVPVSLGSNCCGQGDEDERYPGGDYITIHTDRSRDTWTRTRHLRELESLSARTGRFVVDDEPIGAGEVNQPGRRSANPNEFFARGVLSRFFGVGATWHCEACLHATVPGPVQQASATAFIAGTRIVPDDVRLQLQDAGGVAGPVAEFRFSEKGFGVANTAIGAFSGVGGAFNILALVGVTGDPGVVYQNGWRAGRVLEDRPGVRVLEIIR